MVGIYTGCHYDKQRDRLDPHVFKHHTLWRVVASLLRLSDHLYNWTIRGCHFGRADSCVSGRRRPVCLGRAALSAQATTVPSVHHSHSQLGGCRLHRGVGVPDRGGACFRTRALPRPGLPNQVMDAISRVSRRQHRVSVAQSIREPSAESQHRNFRIHGLSADWPIDFPVCGTSRKAKCP